MILTGGGLVGDGVKVEVPVVEGVGDDVEGETIMEVPVVEGVGDDVEGETIMEVPVPSTEPEG